MMSALCDLPRQQHELDLPMGLPSWWAPQLAQVCPRWSRHTSPGPLLLGLPLAARSALIRTCPSLSCILFFVFCVNSFIILFVYNLFFFYFPGWITLTCSQTCSTLRLISILLQLLYKIKRLAFDYSYNIVLISHSTAKQVAKYLN